MIDAHPESFRLEEMGNRIFVNVPDKKEIEVFDGVTMPVDVRCAVIIAPPPRRKEAKIRL